jgi:hypothetical protein
MQRVAAVMTLKTNPQVDKSFSLGLLAQKFVLVMENRGSSSDWLLKPTRSMKIEA